jgi:glutathione S-transferase
VAERPVTEARAISIIAWFSNTVHPAFAHFIRPERFTADAAGADKVKEQGRKTFWGCLQEIDQMLAGKEWVLGSQFTVCDPFALVFFGFGLRAELPMKDLKNYSALKDRLLKRPAVRKVLEREQSPILKAARHRVLYHEVRFITLKGITAAPTAAAVTVGHSLDACRLKDAHAYFGRAPQGGR